MAANQSENAPGQSRGGRRRGRGGGAYQQRHMDSQHPDDGRTSSFGRGSRPRGRGGRGGREKQQTSQNNKTGPQLPGINAVETDGKNKSVAEDTTEDVDEREICFICASKVEHFSVSPCNHRTCHICALRLRALYKTKACAHCRVCIFPSQFSVSLKAFYSSTD